MTSGSSLDPIFPLPANTGPPEIKAGEGADLFKRNDHVANGMTYRSFYVLWEQAEHRAREHYKRYLNGHLPHVAETWLEAIVYLRQIGNPNVQIEPISEKKAQKIRAKEAEAAKKKKVAKKASGEDDVPEGPIEADPIGTAVIELEPNQCPKCGPHRTILKVKKKGVKMYRCADCGHVWPRKGPQKATTPSIRPSKGRKTASGTKAPGKKKPAPQKKEKRAKKGS